AFAKFAAYIYPPVSDANILWGAGASKLNAAQTVPIVTIVFLTWLNSRGVKNGKILQAFLTIIEILSLLGLIVFGLMLAANAEVWNANWENAWEPKKFITDSMSWEPITGIALISGISAAMVGS